ncbi:DUF4113 domain-containing protein [Serratia fonticola]|uniref:DUF4113 domain-containing protein n=1 Tax=Serratia fonticola TaxID=47917 RepID=A0AAW3WWC0_SERFO|nr:DUF4113 domain-containing protein [Serratia fonticola]MBC3219677.1 DUF4113 domain-containing protein [Serratia fonticola]NBJ34240.1 DUF4113 domain-containing protein [Serratia fonticola]NYA16215.1 DUF4113 domain-containing protein [Serratia fonticola]NYA35996.1 DUF4113 domain-containing protein [Serratia fonticola]
MINRRQAARKTERSDILNTTGLGKIWFGGQGIDKGWRMKREMLSPAYTTRWKNLSKAIIK